MAESAFDRIRSGLEDAIAHASGDASRAEVRPPALSALDVAAIRARLGLTQPAFARLCGVSVGTLRNWEQGRRQPRGPSRALLSLVAAEPEAALRAMQRQVA